MVDILVLFAVAVVVGAVALAVLPGAAERGDDALVEDLIALLDLDPDSSPNGAQVQGVRVERAPDGSVCVWHTRADGTTIGVWDHPAESHPHRAVFDMPPGPCPEESDRIAFGFDGSP